MPRTDNFSPDNYLLSYLDKGIESFSSLISKLYSFENFKSRYFFHPATKILFMFSGVLTVSIVKEIRYQIIVMFFVYFLIFISKVKISDFLKLISLPVFLFGLVIPSFSVFNFITPGEIVFSVFKLKSEADFFVIKLPSCIGISKEGLSVFFLLFLRVFNSVSISFFVMVTVGLSNFFIGMKFFRIPDFLITIFFLTLKYLEIFSRIIIDMYMSRKSRVYNSFLKKERKWLFFVIFYLFKKSIKKQNDIFNSMLSRGFSGNFHIRKLPKFNKIDYAFVFLFELFFSVVLIYSYAKY